MTTVDYGTYFTNLRERNRLTIAELSRRSGVSSSYICRIEQGERRPHPDTLKKLQPHLNVGYNELMGRLGYLCTEETLYVDDTLTKHILRNMTWSKKQLLIELDALVDSEIDLLAQFLSNINKRTSDRATSEGTAGEKK